MEEWKIDFEWLRIRHMIKDSMGSDKLPDLKAVLFLIGIQELGQIQKEFSKEEKQDLMHIAVCTLLESQGHYVFVGRDQDGWPHWKLSKKIAKTNIEDQEVLLKSKIIEYFDNR